MKHWNRTFYSALMQAVFLAIPVSGLTQEAKENNLVFNPGFEEHRRCPEKIDPVGTLTIVDAWFQPTKGSADYYNTCGAKDCFVPTNKLGIQYPHSGEGYCGIYCSKTNYREYLQTQLKEPLKAGEKYRLSFFVSLSEYSAGAVSTIGGLFTRDCPSDTTRGLLMKKEVKQITPKISQVTAIPYSPQVVNDYDNVLFNTSGWEEIAGNFIAEGGEEYLTIGNFFTAANSNLADDSVLLTYLLPGAYYYIDDISVTCLTCHNDRKPQIAEEKKDTTKYSVGATFVLNNIFFDTDKSILLQQSYHELQYLIAILESHPSMKIEISGHTDSQGSDRHNQTLSENRAKEVVSYLVENGISERRLKYAGYGKTRPVASNATEEGRKKNRRVEFKILAM